MRSECQGGERTVAASSSNLSPNRLADLLRRAAHQAVRDVVDRFVEQALPSRHPDISVADAAARIAALARLAYMAADFARHVDAWSPPAAVFAAPTASRSKPKTKATARLKSSFEPPAWVPQALADAIHLALLTQPEGRPITPREIIDYIEKDRLDAIPEELRVYPSDRSRLPRWQNMVYHYLSELRRRGLVRVEPGALGRYYVTDQGRMLLDSNIPLAEPEEDEDPEPILRQALRAVLAERGLQHQSPYVVSSRLKAYLRQHHPNLVPLTAEPFWSRRFLHLLDWAAQEGLVALEGRDADGFPSVVHLAIPSMARRG